MEDIATALDVGPLNARPSKAKPKHFGPPKLWREERVDDTEWRLNYRPKETWGEWFAEEERAVVDEFKKGEEWVETALKDAGEVIKDAGEALWEEDKVIYKKVVGGAWSGVKTGLHGTVDLATAGVETVLSQLGLPVLVVGAAVFVLWNSRK